MSCEPLVYRIAFASLKGINRTLAGEILSRVGGEEDFFAATDSALSSMMGVRSKIFDRTYRDTLIEKAKKEADFIAAHSIAALYFTDAAYPGRLDDCEDAPLMLYATGSCDLNKSVTIGIVGTRHATPYGIEFTERLVNALADSLEEAPVIVSGLAFGIDIAAHRAALKRGLPTVAVLAHGLNTIYPAQHRQAAVNIARSNGLLLTEYSSSDPVHKGNFVARNRIVAGLCDCLFVAESAVKGGALITAALAADYNRDVFALPGRISDKYSAGCNKLIAGNSAALISDPDDLIDAMGWRRKPEQSVTQTLFAELLPEEQAVVDYLTEKGEARVNQLSIALDISVGKLMALLIDMEFKGILLAFPGARYRLAKA
ncbi:MAG: DNA-processing protein DprA [Paramuribaculum sp.]|nr:DNA-processing protein DprA [Paramuribaculum sp.]